MIDCRSDSPFLRSSRQLNSESQVRLAMEQSNELSHRIEPSNSIEYKGRTIKARIDPDLVGS